MDKITNDINFAAIIGIDWASEKHDICCYDCATGKQSSMIITHTPEILAEWIAELRRSYNNQPVAICLEQSRGALVHALLGHDFIYLYPINPETQANYRKAFSPSRAKNDPTDAELLMDILLKHADKFKCWCPDDKDTRKLALLNEQRRAAVDERKKLVQRVKAFLNGYFPQALDLLADNVTSNLACDFIQKWPTLDAIKRAKTKTIREFYYGHNYRRGDLIEKNIEIVRNAVALTHDEAIIDSYSLTVQTLADQIRCINTAIRKYDDAIDALYKIHPDAFIFSSFPGAAKVMGPRLLTAFGADRDRYNNANEVQMHTGTAPVTESSGKSVWVHWRWACPTFKRQSFHEFSNLSIRFSVWARAYYELQRQRGKGHHAAIRALAFKWQRIMFRCWKDRTAYDEAKYLLALKASGSPLWEMCMAIQNS